MAVKKSDNGKSSLFVVGDKEAKLSIAHAMAMGYRITLDGDGNAEIVNPDSRAYYVQNFECDCPDKRMRGGSYHGRCKHEGWIGQMRPCEMCGAVMYLGEFKTAFGECLMRFECPACGNARDHELVREERTILRDGGPQDERLMPADAVRPLPILRSAILSAMCGWWCVNRQSLRRLWCVS